MIICCFLNNIIRSKIQFDSSYFSCLTPSISPSSRSEAKWRMGLSLIRWLSKRLVDRATEFIFYKCSSFSSSRSCEELSECRWCSNRSSSSCQSVRLFDISSCSVPSNRSVDIPSKFARIDRYSRYQCRLNETISGSIDEEAVCHIARTPLIPPYTTKSIFLQVSLFNSSIGLLIELFLYRCGAFHQRSEGQLNTSLASP